MLIKDICRKLCFDHKATPDSSFEEIALYCEEK